MDDFRAIAAQSSARGATGMGLGYTGDIHVVDKINVFFEGHPAAGGRLRVNERMIRLSFEGGLLVEVSDAGWNKKP
jgi:hypothetical protein